jgi:hypothetical protein
MKMIFPSIFLFLTALATLHGVDAIVTRGNPNDAKFLANVERDAPFFVSLYEKNFMRGDCAGTIVDDNHVVTAAHCAAGLDNAPKTILSNGNVVEPWAVFMNPDCVYSVAKDGPNGCDVAVLAFEEGALSSNGDSLASLPVYPFSDEVGSLMTLYGYGLSGDAADLSRGCNRASEDGKFRRAQNIVTDTSDGVIRYQMNNNGGLDLEGMAQDGDSGGAATITKNGMTYLIGANSGTMERNSCDYGSIDEYVRLSEHYDFIAKTLDPNDETICPWKIWKEPDTSYSSSCTPVSADLDGSSTELPSSDISTFDPSEELPTESPTLNSSTEEPSSVSSSASSSDSSSGYSNNKLPGLRKYGTEAIVGVRSAGVPSYGTLLALPLTFAHLFFD